MVLAVEINGDARAYPIEPLVSYEIVNDVVGGVPVAITWCPLCYTGLVYERVWEGQTLTPGRAGRALQGRADLVGPRDRQHLEPGVRGGAGRGA